jgi:hypothetical protein
MSSGCGDVLNLQDLQTAKKHQIFEAEVITGKAGGVAGGADIDYATNQVTGQTQKTLPAILRDVGFEPAAFDFTTGGTLGVNDRDKVVYDPVSKTWYSWGGALPKVIPAGTSPVGDANWTPQTDPNLRADLASTASNKGASLIGTTSGLNVEQRFSDIEKVKANTGFDVVGRFLNISALRAFTSGVAGQLVFVASAANATNAELPVGGGYFKAVAKGSLSDDGGVTIVPASGTVAWVRTNTQKIYIEYFGAIGDGVYDSTSAILEAMTYGRVHKVNIYAGPGIFETSSSIPVWSSSGLIGSGREKTIFEKTTNNPYTISTGVTADAFVVMMPTNYSPDGSDITNYAAFTTIDGFTVRRKGLTGRANSVAYGIWAGKLCVSTLSNLRVECGYFGFWGEDVWSNEFNSVQFLGLGVRQFCGVQISRYRSGVYALSGTSNVFNLVGVANYQFAFTLNSLQYSTLNSCTADGISPMVDLGENQATAYAFINPHGITMNACGSEGVQGQRISVIGNSAAVYDLTVTINSFQGQIEQLNPLVAGTPIYRIQSDSTKFTSVSLINCNLKKDASLTNQVAGFIAGAATQVFNIGSIIDVPTLSGGATFKSL